MRIIHQTGPKEAEELAKGFQATGLDGEIAPFIQDVAGAMSRADLMISRSGASTVSEIAAAGRPAILIPFARAADNHQLRNAESFARAGGGIVIEETELTGARLAAEVSALASEPDRLRRMGECARTLAKPGAANRAVEILEEVARQNG